MLLLVHFGDYFISCELRWCWQWEQAVGQQCSSSCCTDLCYFLGPVWCRVCKQGAFPDKGQTHPSGLALWSTWGLGVIFQLRWVTFLWHPVSITPFMIQLIPQIHRSHEDTPLWLGGLEAWRICLAGFTMARGHRNHRVQLCLNQGC